MVAVLKQLPLDTVYCRVRSCKYLMAFWPHYPWLSELSGEHSYVLVTNRRYSHRGAQVWPLVSVRACVWPGQQWIREKRNECGLFCDLWARLVKRVLRLWLQTRHTPILHRRKTPPPTRQKGREMPHFAALYGSSCASHLVPKQSLTPLVLSHLSCSLSQPVSLGLGHIIKFTVIPV